MFKQMSKPLIVAGAISAMALGMLVYMLTSNSPGSRAVAYQRLTVLPDGRPLPEFELLAHTGAAFTRENFHGRRSILFFGFTHCPDVCPTTLYQLARVQSQLDDLPLSDRPAIYMVSVDPQRDTPETMARYVQAFDQGFTGVTGAADEIERVTRSLGVAHGKEPGEDGEYSVLHSAALFFLNAEGHFVAVASAPHDVDVLVSDYRKLLSDPRA